VESTRRGQARAATPGCPNRGALTLYPGAGSAGARLRGRARLGLLRVGDGLQVDHAHLARLPDAV